MHGRDSRRNHSGNYNNYGYYNGNNNNNHRTGGQTRNHVIPDEPPYTAYIGHAPDTMVQGDFEHQLFVGLKVKQVRLVRDRQTDRFRGFAYVDFEDADSLRSAIALDGTCVNDRPIRIDVASRPLGASKSDGFKKKSGFESRSGPRQSSGYNNNNNRSMDGFRPNDRDKTQHEVSPMIDGYYENGYNNASSSSYSNKINLSNQTSSRHNSEKQTQVQKEFTPPPLVRNVSDEVFITPDTPTTNENENHENKEDITTTIIRQLSRNWADCPIDDSVVDTSPPPSANNTLITNDIDDFQIVRNKTPKSRTNQNTSSRSIGNQSMRGRNNGNYSRGLSSSHTSAGGGDGGGRHYYDQMSSSYTNQYYHQHNSQIPSHSLSMNFSYNNNNNNNNNNRHQQSSATRQRLNSNRSNNNQTSNDDQSNRNGQRLTSATSNSSYDINTTSSENRPRLQLLPRSQKLSSSTDDNQSSEEPTRNSNIFGCGKPRDERDPKVVELNKHIDDIVEKEQHLPRIKSTSSNESTLGVNKPVRILSARSEYSIEH